MQQNTGYKTKKENMINVGNHNLYLNLCINYNCGLNLLLFSNYMKSPNAPLSSLSGSSSADQNRKLQINNHNFMIEETILFININEDEHYEADTQ